MNTNERNVNFHYLVGTVVTEGTLNYKEMKTFETFRVAILDYAGIYTRYENLGTVQQEYLKGLYELITAPAVAE